MKNLLLKISAILITVSLTAGIITGCNGRGLLPFVNPDDYYDKNDDDVKDTEDKEDDDTRATKGGQEPVIPDPDETDKNEPVCDFLRYLAAQIHSKDDSREKSRRIKSYRHTKLI